MYTSAAKDVLRHFSSDEHKGLTLEQVVHRQEKYGANELKAKKKISPFVLFLNQFRSIIIYILIFALVISALSGEIVDAITILAILLFNAIIGFIQEYKAEKAIDALKKVAAHHTTVLRAGKKIQVLSKDLVPGDIIFLEEGNKVPADARLLHVTGLQVSESSLTGESTSVSKDVKVLHGKIALSEQKNMVFSGTLVTRGKAVAVVTAIGMHTEIGKIADMISSVEDDLTPLQHKLETLGKYLGIITIFVSILVFVIGVTKGGYVSELLAGDYMAILDKKEWFLTAVALAVAAVPEGLPAIVTIALAIAVRRMLHKKTLIRRLPSVETLGETTVICSDKTGTITRNEMTVRHAFVDGAEFTFSGLGYAPYGDVTSVGKVYKKSKELLFAIGTYCNDAALHSHGKSYSITGDPTEAALVVSAKKIGLELPQRVVHKEIPFDSVRRMMSVVVNNPFGKGKVVYSKGAAEQILEKSTKILKGGRVVTLSSAMKKELLQKNKQYSTNALRVLAFAYKPTSTLAESSLEKDLIFVGMQGMIDPPHKEVKHAIERCHQAGIRVIMITGDNPHTAKAIAHEVGIQGGVIDGKSFDQMNVVQQKKAVQDHSIFARVEPSHKMLIVQLLQDEGHIVAMTGDGVNDAPAIKKSNLGIAMGITGTDVAKETSDMVLQDDNFTTIVNAVEEGRGIYHNIQKFVNYLLSCNAGEVLVILSAVLFGFPLPMTAIMLLWLNLVTDGLPALALSVDPNPKDLMKRPPQKPGSAILDKRMTLQILFTALFFSAGVLFVFWWGTLFYQDLEKLQTLAFTAIILCELVRIQSIRSDYKLSLFSNKYLVAAVATSLGLHFLILYTPLSVLFGTQPLLLVDWAVILAVTLVVALVIKVAMVAVDRFVAEA